MSQAILEWTPSHVNGLDCNVTIIAPLNSGIIVTIKKLHLKYVEHTIFNSYN